MKQKIARITSKYKKDDKSLDICAPLYKGDSDTCYTLELLQDIAQAVNIYFKTREAIKITDSKKYLLAELTEALKDVSDDQVGWLKQTFINNYLYKKYGDKIERIFLPEGPAGRYEWLSTTDIEYVSKLYPDKYPEFAFFGAVPLDFGKLSWCNIKNINYSELEKTKTKLGVIFNLDYSHQKGSHWVGLYSDLKTAEVYYFDSYGSEPPREVDILMDRICSYLRTKGKSPIKRHSTFRHQYGNSECGVFSMVFIIRLLIGDKFEDIQKYHMTDAVINECRDLFFRNGPNVGGSDNKCKKLLKL